MSEQLAVSDIGLQYGQAGDLFPHAMARKLASLRGWWMTDNFAEEPNRASVDMYATGQLRLPEVSRIAAVLPTPLYNGEVIAIRTMVDCEVPDVIISFDGFLDTTLRLLVHVLPNLRR